MSSDRGLPLITPDSTPEEIKYLSPYGYIPSATAAIAYIVVFSFLALVHIFQGVRGKYWVVFPTIVLGCIGEIIGWSGRLWSNKNINLETPFMMQIASLIISPVFFSAFLYTVLGNAIRRINPTYSILTPRWFVTIFLTGDVLCLVLQAIGGGWAASVTPSPKAASNLMLAGIILQLIIMLIFVFVGTDFALRIKMDKPYKGKQRRFGSGSRSDSMVELGAMGSAGSSVVGGKPGRGSTGGKIDKTAASMGNPADWEGMNKGWWLLFLGMFICSLAIIIRGIYRSAELAEGWDGELIQRETLQNFLDGFMMVVAVASISSFHPLHLLPRKATWRGVL